jgi:hypothetical protein
VVAMTSGSEDMPEVLNLAWERLLPGFGPEPFSGRQEADADLAERLARLALRTAPGKQAPPDRSQAWSGAEFTPDDGAREILRGEIAVQVSADGDGWRLTLVEDGHRMELPLGQGGWTVTEEPVPVGVSAGWTDADTLVADLAFLETPHHLVVTCSLTDRTFGARWSTEPLSGGRLRRMKAPRGPVGSV